MSYSEEIVQQVWEKADVEPGHDPNIMRKDECEAWISRQHYGIRASEYGWEIDHIKPLSQGGTDELPNFRPLQWENKTTKRGDCVSCPVTALGGHNIRLKK